MKILNELIFNRLYKLPSYDDAPHIAIVSNMKWKLYGKMIILYNNIHDEINENFKI